MNQETLNELLSTCMRIDELASTLACAPTHENAKMISEDEITPMSPWQRKKRLTDVRVSFAKWMKENVALDEDGYTPEWEANFNGFVINIRKLVEHLHKAPPEEPPKQSKQDIMRRDMYYSQGGKCKGCAHRYHPARLEIDHIEPQSLGGTDDPENLQLLCSFCNNLKGELGMDSLKAKLRDRGLLE